MASEISTVLNKPSYGELEKVASFIELSSQPSSFMQLQTADIKGHAVSSVLQENLRQLMKRIGFDDVFLSQIPSEEFLSKESVIIYLFNEILEDFPQALWKNLNFEALLKLQDEDGMDIILTGIKRGKKEFLAYVLRNINKAPFTCPQDHRGRGMLHIAAIYGQDDIASYLLFQHAGLVNLKGQDVDGLTPIQWAIHEGHEKVIQTFLDQGVCGQTWKVGKASISLLALAVVSGHPNVVSLILNHNQLQDVHLIQAVGSFGSILHLAILSNQPQMLQYLLHDEHKRTEDLLEIVDVVGRTPLHLAAFLGDLFAIRELHKKNAYIHKGEYASFGTPLHWAVKGRHPLAISLLLSLGADPSRIDEDGKAPIAYLDEKNLNTPLAKRCKNILDNFILSKRLEKVKDVDFYKRAPFNLIFEGSCITFDSFIGALQGLESKKMLTDVRRYSGKGLGSIVGALLAIGYTSSQIEELSFKGLEDLFKQNPDLTNAQIKEIESAYLQPIFSLSPHLPVLCDINKLRRDLEEIIYSKTNIHHLTFGQLKEKVQTSPNLYKHVHIPIYSFYKKNIIFFNTEEDKYRDFVLSDVLAASLTFLGLFQPVSLRRKNLEGQLYSDDTYGKTMSIPFHTLLVDRFDDFSYQECPYLKGKITNYRTLSLKLDQPLNSINSSSSHSILHSHLITKHLDEKEIIGIPEKISLGRIKKIDFPIQGGEEDVKRLAKRHVKQLFSQTNAFLPMQMHEKSLAPLQAPSAWKYEIFRKNKKQFEQKMAENDIKSVITLPKQSIFFTGREKELKALEDSFQVTKKIAISGLGGIGKSTLSLKYASSLKDYGFIHFIKATALGSIKTGLIELAGLLSIDKETFEEKIAELKIYLQKTSQKSLLIIDGLDEEAYFQELNHYIPPESKCSILISTRIGDKAEVKGFKTISLTSFTPEEATYYLTGGRVVSLQEKTAAEALAKEIGYLPLALSHIARYLDQEKITLCEYEKCFQDRSPKLPGKDAINLPDDEISIFITWQVSLEAIAKKEMGELAISLMHFISFLGEENIPFNLITTWVKSFSRKYTVYDIKLSLKLLKDYAFLKEKIGEMQGDIDYMTHSLVQKVIAYQLTCEARDKEFIRTTIRVLNQEINELRRPYREPLYIEDERRKKLYSVHVSKIFSLLGQETDHLEYVQLLSHLAWFSINVNRDERHLEYINQGLERAKYLEDSQKKIMTAELYMLKNARDALCITKMTQLEKEALEIRAQVYEHDSECIIESHATLGSFYQRESNYVKALEEYQKVLKWQKIKLIKNNSWIGNTYLQLINILNALGRKEEVLEVTKDELNTLKEAWGEGDYRILQSCQRVIKALHEVGKKEEAVEVAKEMLKTQKEVWGERSCATIISYQAVIDALKEAGRKEEALEIARDMLKTQQKKSEKEGGQVLESYQEVIGALKGLGRKEEALEQAKDLLKTQQETSGKRKSEVAESYREVIETLKDLNRKEEVLEVAQEMLKTQKEVLGEKDLWTLRSYHEVISAFNELGRKEEALQFTQEMLKIQREVLGEKDSWTYRSYHEVISALNELRRKEEALQFTQEMLKIQREVLGEKDSWTHRSYHEVISAFNELGRKEEALEFAKEMLKTQKNILEKGSDAVLGNYELMIRALKELGRNEEALEVAYEMLRVWCGGVRDRSLWGVYSYQEIIKALMNLGAKKEALEIAKDMIKTQKETFGEDSLEAFYGLETFIGVLNDLGRQEEALEVLQEALKNQKEVYTEDSIEILNIRMVLIWVLYDVRESEALDMAEKVLSRWKKTFQQRWERAFTNGEEFIKFLVELKKVK